MLQRYAARAGSLAVAREGKLLFVRGYTWAEPDYPVTQADSPFRLASVSKAFTAAVIYQLLQAKKLELSLPVFPWLGLDRASLAAQTVDPRLATNRAGQPIVRYAPTPTYAVKAKENETRNVISPRRAWHNNETRTHLVWAWTRR